MKRFQVENHYLYLGHMQNHSLGQGPQLYINMVDALDLLHFDISEMTTPDHQLKHTKVIEVMEGSKLLLQR
jgi:hypothetical protein